jgi:hypothetical protein
MKKTTLRILVAGAACFAVSSALAYDSPVVYNAAHYPVNVIVRYSGCQPDSFAVPAATPQGPGIARAGSNRGACLITTVSAAVQGRSFPVVDYTSSGTSHSRFLVRYQNNGGYKIFSDWELQNTFDREAQNPASPEGTGFNVPHTPNPLNAPQGSPLQATIAACRAANVQLDKDIDAIYMKAQSERKITSAEAARYQQLEAGIRARRTLLASDGFTLADCHTMTKLYDAEKAEVMQMAR